MYLLSFSETSTEYPKLSPTSIFDEIKEVPGDDQLVVDVLENTYTFPCVRLLYAPTITLYVLLLIPDIPTELPK